MKKLILSLLIAISIPCVAQKYNFPVNKAGKIEFTQTLEVPISKEKLFANAQQWIVTTFKDYRAAVQVEDKENGKLIVTGTTRLPYIYMDDILIIKEDVDYTFTIECKDNKYRYTVSNIEFQEIVNFGKPERNSPLAHVEVLEKYTKEYNLYIHQLDSAKALLDTKLSKKERKNTEKRIKYYQFEIRSIGLTLKRVSTFHDEEYNAIISLIRSLKKAMNKQDEF